jgi:type VI secretion system protein ImpB
MRSIAGLDNIDGLIKDMNMSLNFKVPNKVDPDNSAELDVSIPIDSMKSFNPYEVAKNVPKLRGLLMLKTLLQEADSNIQNKKALRHLIEELYGSGAAYEKLLEQLKDFKDFRIPTGKKEEE